MTETQLKNNAGIRFNGYTFFGRSRLEGRGGGVGILVKNEIKYRVVPHTSDKDIEILWVSVRRHEEKPIYVGVYYGKQESLSKADIEYEMDLLSEELMEKSSEGYIILAMDGNGKIGLMDGKKSRNGILLMEVFEEAELTVVNGTEKCSGTVTCQNTKKPDEKSAINFVVCSSEVNDNIENMIINFSEGLFQSDNGTGAVQKTEFQLYFEQNGD